MLGSALLHLNLAVFINIACLVVGLYAVVGRYIVFLVRISTTRSVYDKNYCHERFNFGVVLVGGEVGERGGEVDLALCGSSDGGVLGELHRLEADESSQQKDNDQR